jgi:hypothetical protein
MIDKIISLDREHQKYLIKQCIEIEYKISGIFKKHNGDHSPKFPWVLLVRSQVS